jgi:hypothetical protein
MTDWQVIGSFADWTAGVAATRALVFAGFASKASRDTNRAQQQTLELQREQFERAQASKVTYTIGRMQLGDGTKPLEFRTGKTIMVSGGDQTLLLNLSDAPVHFVYIYDPTQLKKILYSADVLFPAGITPIRVPLIGMAGWPFGATMMAFRDSNGLQWIRDHSGGLEKATDEDVKAVQALRDQIRNESRPDGG